MIAQQGVIIGVAITAMQIKLIDMHGVIFLGIMATLLTLSFLNYKISMKKIHIMAIKLEDQITENYKQLEELLNKN